MSGWVGESVWTVQAEEVVSCSQDRGHVAPPCEQFEHTGIHCVASVLSRYSKRWTRRQRRRVWTQFAVIGPRRRAFGVSAYLPDIGPGTSPGLGRAVEMICAQFPGCRGFPSPTKWGAGP